MLCVCGTLSISSSLRSLPSISSADSRIPASPPPRTRLFHLRSRKVVYPVRASKVSVPTVDDGCSPDQFLENNSIADFMRFRRVIDDGGQGELQTAVVRYQKRFPWSLLHPFLQVDLVSTIHIADKEYFAALQHELKHYDCVLYEMVASRESLENRKNAVTKKPKDSRNQSFNIIGCLQRLMAHVLTLDFQLDCLDYEGKNWYHADLDYETFKSRQSERGENFFTFARDMTLRSAKAVVEPSIPEDLEPWKSKLLWASRVLPMPLVGLLIIGSVCTQSENSALEYPELEALSRLDFGAAMKVFLAKRLTSEFKLGPTAAEEGSVIIGERNKVAVDVLQQAISDGHNKIAILYGGGHMPDLGRRLREELDLTPSQVQWITAWSIRNRELDMQSFPFLRTLAKISGWPLNRYQTLGLLIFSAVLAVDLWFWELFVGTVVNWTALVAAEVVQFAENMQIIRQSVDIF